MKKLLLVLGMITCILGITACGKTEEATKVLMTEEEAISNAEYVVELLYMIDSQGMIDQYADYPVVVKALESWKQAAADMGDYKEIKGSEAIVEEKEAIVNVTVVGSTREAVVEVMLDATGFTNISTNVTYSIGERMEKAALNTLMGLGTVFAVLILISLIISCFKFIPNGKIVSGKKEKVEDIKAKAVEKVVEQIAVRDELSDDLELVAVISAAIAASEGATSTEGYVVRSIKRANTKKWQNA